MGDETFIAACEACKSTSGATRTSDACDHTVCVRCLWPSLARGTNLLDLPPQTPLKCPVCGEAAELRAWNDGSTTDQLNLEQERSIRVKVFGTFNKLRANFPSTPAYDQYLERREEIVWTLVHSSDSEQVASLQEELQTMEVENQREIVENQQKALQLEAEEIRRIVEKEGIFAEMVATDYAVGFTYTPAQRAAMMHPLVRLHPEIFEQVPSSGEVAGHLEGVQLLGNRKPQPLQAHIEYDRLAAKPPTDRAALLRACGMRRRAVALRMGQEFTAGLLATRSLLNHDEAQQHHHHHQHHHSPGSA